MKNSLRRLHLALLRIHRFSIRHPKRALFAIFSFVLFFSFQLPKLKTILAMEDVVDNTFTSKQHLNELRRDFKLGSAMNLMIERPEEGWSDEALCLIHDWLIKQKIESRDIVSSFSVFDIRQVQNSQNHLRYPNILTLTCLTDQPTAALPNSAIEEQLKRANASPFGIQTVSANLAINIQVDLHEDESESKTGSFNPKVIQARQRSFDEMVNDRIPNLRYHWVGPSDMQNYLFTGLKRVNILNLALILFLLIGFRVFFRTWTSGIIYAASIIATATTVLGLMAYWGIPMDILSKSLFLMIAVAALEDFLFLSFLRVQTKCWRTPFRELMLPGFLTSFTTTLGFGSLMISDLQIIDRFGFWAAVASMLEWLLVFVAVPSLMKLFPALRHWTSNEISRPIIWVQKFKLKTPSFKLVRLSFIFFPLAIFAFQHLNVTDVPAEMFPTGHKYKAGVEALQTSFGWQAQLSLIFSNPRQEDKVSILETLAKHKLVTKIVDPQTFIDWFNKDISNTTTRQLITSEVRNAQFFQNFFSTIGSERVAILVNQSDSSSIDQLTQHIKQLCHNKDCHVTGVPVVYAEFSNLVPKTLLDSFTLSIFLVSLVILWLAWGVGHLKTIWSLLVSSFWGLAVMFFIIGAAQIKVTFLTCIFASILVGLTGDNAIQFLCTKHKSFDDACLKRGEPALLCGLFMACCSMIFLGSYFVPPRLFGILLASGFLMSMVGDYWILRSIRRGGLV